ncbi:MAG TPA: hypothetical protein VFA89_06885 [Terriglobales bacterium]|nr:hypothetical protein [Terriglobales bacterium]
MRKLLCVVFALCSAIFAAAQDDHVVSSGRLELVNDIRFDECTNENVIFNGFVDYEVRQFVDSQGALHIKMSERYVDVFGVGETSGADYRLKGRSIEKRFTAEAGIPARVTQVVVFKIQGAGPIPDAISRVTFHSVVKRDGSTFEIGDITFDCTGDPSP